MGMHRGTLDTHPQQVQSCTVDWPGSFSANVLWHKRPDIKEHKPFSDLT